MNLFIGAFFWVIEMQRAVLTRLVNEDKQTLGHFTLFEGCDRLFECKSLELPENSNLKNISCIPKGEYHCAKRYSPKYGWHFLVKELDGGHVSGREWILIHFGNYYHNSKGCILLGADFVDVNGDGYRDVTSSRRTMRTINKLTDEVFMLSIV